MTPVNETTEDTEVLTEVLLEEEYNIFLESLEDDDLLVVESTYFPTA